MVGTLSCFPLECFAKACLLFSPHVAATARPNPFGMPGIVPPYVPPQMLNIPQATLQAKPVVRLSSCPVIQPNSPPRGQASISTSGWDRLCFDMGQTRRSLRLSMLGKWGSTFYAWVPWAAWRQVCMPTSDLCLLSCRCPAPGLQARVHTRTALPSPPSAWSPVGRAQASRTATAASLPRASTPRCTSAPLPSTPPLAAAPTTWTLPTSPALPHRPPQTMMTAVQEQRSKYGGRGRGFEPVPQDATSNWPVHHAQ